MSAPKMIQPDPKDIVVVQFEPSLDGHFAAWVVYKAARQYQVPVMFIRAGDGLEDMTGRHLIMLGYVASDVANWHDKVKSMLVFDVRYGRLPDDSLQAPLPEPLPFRKWERQMPYKVVSMAKPGQRVGSVVSPGGSLTKIAYEFFAADRLGIDKTPRVVDIVSDCATGAYKYRDSVDLFACLDTYDYDPYTMDKLAEALEKRDTRDMMIAAGQAVRRYKAKHGL